ncbi:MAG TPA: hypothetical protein VF666_09140 [Pyrinomonadaceae bacterium]
MRNRKSRHTLFIKRSPYQTNPLATQPTLFFNVTIRMTKHPPQTYTKGQPT